MTEKKSISKLCLAPNRSIREAIRVIDENGKRLMLVVDGQRRLLGVVTDGDVRRDILGGQNLEDPVSDLLSRMARRPVTASMDATPAQLLQQMETHEVLQIPLLDDKGRVVDLVTKDDLAPRQALPVQAVIMAGGEGTRLLPLTEETPKPMLPVGKRPIMEHIVKGLRDAGINRVNITTHYKPEKIMSHFGDGSNFGVEMNYVTEDQPLGTAGSLGLMKSPTEPILVINGDILTRVDFRAMLAFHQEHKSALTVGVRQYDLSVPYGVVDCDGPSVRQIKEKPVVKFLVNAGMYLLEPLVYGHIPHAERMDMTDLIHRLIEAGETVVSFPIREYWLDVGQPGDYQKAQRDAKKGVVDQ